MQLSKKSEQSMGEFSAPVEEEEPKEDENQKEMLSLLRELKNQVALGKLSEKPRIGVLLWPPCQCGMADVLKTVR